MTYLRVLPLLLTLALISCRNTSGLTGGSPHDILLTIDDNEVTAGEFLYSFKKSHQNEDTLTKSSVDDYLQLFINYKLKVLQARSSGYDTAENYTDELAGYQEQLKSSYRTSEKIVQDLKREAYERMQQEIKASHILIMVAENASPEDTLAAFQKIIELKKRAREGKFDEIAFKYSEDPSAKVNKGNLGYFTTFQMLYPFETAAYNTEVGEISDPVRTNYGYHIIKVHDKRPSSYQVKLYQVQLSGKNAENKSQVVNKIFEIHEMLQNGLKPEQLSTSVDEKTFLLKTGSLPPMTLTRAPREIQQVAMQLNSPGEISDPVQSEFGWHIFILEEKLPFPLYEDIENQLENMVRKSNRALTYKSQLRDLLYKKHKVDMLVIKDNIYEIVKDGEGNILFTIDQRNYNREQFVKYLEKESIDVSSKAAVEKAYSSYVEKQVMKIEDQKIIEANPELNWLLKEYEEGILLFNIMEDSIWDRAVTDKERLKNFMLDKDSTTMIPNDSAFSESAGSTIVDYQQYLEDQWVKRLREKYKVVINQDVLDRVYKEALQDAGKVVSDASL